MKTFVVRSTFTDRRQGPGTGRTLEVQATSVPGALGKTARDFWKGLTRKQRFDCLTVGARDAYHGKEGDHLTLTCSCANVLNMRIRTRAQEGTVRKVPVSERALIQRLNRKIKEDDLVLKKCRPDSRAYNDLGDYFIVDINRNVIIERKLDPVDLQSMGRAKKVLEDWEELEKGK